MSAKRRSRPKAPPPHVAAWHVEDHIKVNGRHVARQYDEAKDAPAWVQDAAFRHVYKRGGLGMWNGTGCPGTGAS